MSNKCENCFWYGRKALKCFNEDYERFFEHVEPDGCCEKYNKLIKFNPREVWYKEE